MKQNKHYLMLILTYLGVILTFATFYFIDIDFEISEASFFNMMVIITLFYVIAFLRLYYLNHQVQKKYLKQLEVLKNDSYLIDEYQDDELLRTFYDKVIMQRQKLVKQDEQQSNWLHDIKIPLTTLKLYIENNRDVLKAEDSQLLDLIALDLENYLNKKIMFDKIELEIDDYNIEKFNLTNLISDVIKKLKANFILKDLRVDFDIETIMIVSDQKRIRYCLEQVIINAIKYSFKQTAVKFSFIETTLIIENTGEPIDSQDLNRLFEQGYTGKNSQNNELMSTGIGLYMVKKSLNHLNHDIKIESANQLTRVMIDFKKVTKM